MAPSYTQCNPLVNAVPSQVGRKRDPQPTKAEKEGEVVTLDRQLVFGMKPEHRAKWLNNVLAQMAQQVLTSSDIYSIVSSNRFIDGIKPKLGKQMAGAVLNQLDLFTAKQKRNLTNCALISNFGELRPQSGELEQDQEADEDNADHKVNDMMARCLAFAQEKAAERGEAVDGDKTAVDGGETKEEKFIDRSIDTPKVSTVAGKAIEKKTDGKSDGKRENKSDKKKAEKKSAGKDKKVDDKTDGGSKKKSNSDSGSADRRRRRRSRSRSKADGKADGRSKKRRNSDSGSVDRRRRRRSRSRSKSRRRSRSRTKRKRVSDKTSGRSSSAKKKEKESKAAKSRSPGAKKKEKNTKKATARKKSRRKSSSSSSSSSSYS